MKPNKMVKSIRIILLLQLKQIVNSPGELFNPLLFFVIVTALFPLGIGSNKALLSTIATPLIWMSAMLSMFLSFNKLFRHEYETGLLDQWCLSPLPLSLNIMTQVLADWLLNGLPLCLIAPLIAIAYGLSGHLIMVLIQSLLLGTPILTLLGALGAALTVSLRPNHLLIAIIVLPWSIPILIFGTSAVAYAKAGLPIAGLMEWLAAGLALAIGLIPVALTALLQANIQER